MGKKMKIRNWTRRKQNNHWNHTQLILQFPRSRNQKLISQLLCLTSTYLTKPWAVSHPQPVLTYFWIKEPFHHSLRDTLAIWTWLTFTASILKVSRLRKTTTFRAPVPLPTSHITADKINTGRKIIPFVWHIPHYFFPWPSSNACWSF